MARSTQDSELLRSLEALERNHPVSLHEPAKNARRALAHLVLLEELCVDPGLYDADDTARRLLAVEGYAREALGLNRQVPEQLVMLQLVPLVQQASERWATGELEPLDLAQGLRKIRKPVQGVVFDSWGQPWHDDGSLTAAWRLATQNVRRRYLPLRVAACHLVLLEEHLNDADMFCGDCIRKHLTAIEAHLREASAGDAADTAKALGRAWLQNQPGVNEQIESFRLRVQPHAFRMQ